MVSQKSDVLAVQLMSGNSSVLICCLYNTLAQNAYQWTTVEIICFFDEREAMMQEESSDRMVTRDLNFAEMKWEPMSFKIPYKEEI